MTRESKPSTVPTTSTTYKDSGVNIDKAASLVQKIASMEGPRESAQESDGSVDSLPGTLQIIGGFSALYEIPKGYENPVIATATDGVGTKLALAENGNESDYHCLGIDLVAMCVNDIICCGAEPKLFLDYYATGVLDEKQALAVIKGIYEGCEQSGARLVGGETAEMPGLYPKGSFDIAGFAVGLVEKDEIINPHANKVDEDQNIVGITSSGIHSNGFSLVRQLIKERKIDLTHQLKGKSQDKSLKEALMTPTNIYVNAIKDIKDKIKIKGLAHITGGGMTENLPRAVPNGWTAQINIADAYDKKNAPGVFGIVQQASNLSDEEMLKTFNCGIGMAIIHPASQTQELIELLQKSGNQARLIGKLVRSSNNNQEVIYI